MWNWLRELYDIRRENKMSRCDSCDILKVELAQERREKERLLNHILNPQPQSEPTAEKPEPIMPKHVPWRVKQQELETRDRQEAARILAQFKDRVKSADTEKLEKDMGISG